MEFSVAYPIFAIVIFVLLLLATHIYVQYNGYEDRNIEWFNIIMITAAISAAWPLTLFIAFISGIVFGINILTKKLAREIVFFVKFIESKRNKNGR